MTALVYGLIRAAEDGWGDVGTIASFAFAAFLLVEFVANERRAEQPITPLRLFSDRGRVGAYIARIFVVGAMYSTFFFLTQYLQVVQGYSALEAGCAFLPMTLSVFAMVRVMPRIAPRLGDVRVLAGGLAIALVGMIWLGQISPGADYLTQTAVPLILLGVGMGSALTPLTTTAMAGVADSDAGAASGVINVAHQLGGTLGVGRPDHGLRRSQQRRRLARPGRGRPHGPHRRGDPDRPLTDHRPRRDAAPPAARERGPTGGGGMRSRAETAKQTRRHGAVDPCHEGRGRNGHPDAPRTSSFRRVAVFVPLLGRPR